MQFQADILGTQRLPAGRRRDDRAWARPIWPGLAVGYWHDQDEIRRNWALDREFVPQMPADERDRLYAKWLKAVERSRDWQER